MKYFLIFFFLTSLFGCHSADTTREIPSGLSHSSQKLIKVGVFNGDGAGAVSVIETIEALKIDQEIEAFPISAAEIVSGKLNEIDVIIFPGGSGSKQLNNLGYAGQNKVKEFVRNGKGIIGICAGAYMLCNTPTYPSLKLAHVKHLDRAHYNRGRGLIEFKLNKEGLKIFPEFKNKPQFIQYYDGPIMEALEQQPDFHPLAVYVTDIHPNEGTPAGLTPGKLFMYYQQVGKGRIFAIGGHAESTPGIRWMIPRMVRIVSGKKLISYDKKWIAPERNHQPILFDKNLIKTEKRLWWKLLKANEKEKLAAMDSLYELRSRPAVRWNIGLLRDSSAIIRAHAANLLKKSEYTHALNDLKAAVKMETRTQTKDTLIEVIEFFEK